MTLDNVKRVLGRLGIYTIGLAVAIFLSCGSLIFLVQQRRLLAIFLMIILFVYWFYWLKPLLDLGDVNYLVSRYEACNYARSQFITI